MADMRPTRRRGGRVYRRHETRERSEMLAATNRRYRDPIDYVATDNSAQPEWERMQDAILAMMDEEMEQMLESNRRARQLASISQDLSTLGMYNPGVN